MQEIALVGNPNCGKTTLFNLLCLSNEHVGNWHGVTVKEKSKQAVINDNNVLITDLPGTYSLNSFSFDEIVTRDYLENTKCDILNIIDGNTLQKGLYLSLCLLENGYNISIFINMKEELDKIKTNIDTSIIEKMLGVQVNYGDSYNKIQMKNLASNLKFTQNNKLSYIFNINIQNMAKILFKNHKNNSIRLVLNYLSSEIKNKEMLSESEIQKLNEYCINNKISKDYLPKLRYDYISQIISKSVCKNNKEKVYGLSKIDDIILNKYFALPIFIGIMLLIFYLTFSLIGPALSSLIADGMNKIITTLNTNITNSNPILQSFLISGVLVSISSILSFLPQIVLLFLFLSILEDSGYLSRLAFIFEDIFSKAGLSGKSIFVILMGFGCSTSAMLTARTIDDNNAKIKTAMLSTYMSCSAKLPIYAVVGGAFFGKQNLLIIFGLYMLSILIATIVAVILEKLILSSNKNEFILEFAPYRSIKLKRIFKLTYDNAKQFIFRVGGVLLVFSLIFWFLNNFSFDLSFSSFSNKNSIITTISYFLSSIFLPLGFNGWGITAALLSGIVAKEVIVSSIAQINGVASSASSMTIIGNSLINPQSVINFTPNTAIVFMVFCLLYCPCLSSIACMKKEIGTTWTTISCVMQFLIAYIISMIIYFLLNIASFIPIYILIIILIIFIIYICIKNSKKCGPCCYCKHKCF